MKKNCILLAVFSIILGSLTALLLKNRFVKKTEEFYKRFQSYYYALNQWLILKNGNMSLEKYFIENDCKNIAIYGIGELGKRLYEELSGSSINIKYFIDKKVNSVYNEIPVYSLEEELEEVDIIVITPIYDFDEIKKTLVKITDSEIVSLNNIIFAI